MLERVLDQEYQPIQVTGGDSSSQNPDVTAPAQAAVPAQQAPRRRILKTKYLKYAAYTFPFATAVREASETAIDLQGKPTAFIVAVTTSNFCAEFGIDSRFTVEGVEHSYKILKKRHLPTDWPVLSKTKEAIAIASSSVMGLYAAFSDSVLAYDFVYKIPTKYAFTSRVNMTGWMALSGTTAGMVGMGRITGEGMATYRITREFLAGSKREYSNRFSHIVSPTAGVVLGVLGSCGDAIMTCTGMVDVFSVTSMSGKITFSVLSSVNGITDYCMNGTFVIECLDVFFGSFTPQDGRTPAYKSSKAIAALSLSLCAGILLAYTYQGIAKESLEELLELLGIDLGTIATPINQVISCGGATSYLINATGSIYDLSYLLADKLGNKLSDIYNSITWCCTRNATAEFFTLSDDEVAIEINEFDLSDDDDSNSQTVTHDDPLHELDQQVLESLNQDHAIDIDDLETEEHEDTSLIDAEPPKSIFGSVLSFFQRSKQTTVSHNPETAQTFNM